MRKSKMVSLNPQYKIEVTTLASLADKLEAEGYEWALEKTA